MKSKAVHLSKYGPGYTQKPCDSALNFGNVIYDVVPKTDAQTLQVLQNQCLRICLKAEPRTPITELNTRANIPMLPG